MIFSIPRPLATGRFLVYVCHFFDTKLIFRSRTNAFKGTQASACSLKQLVSYMISEAHLPSSSTLLIIYQIGIDIASIIYSAKILKHRLQYENI